MTKNKSPLTCSTCPSKLKGVFCELDQNKLDEISTHKVSNVYKKGQSLFVEGNHPYGLFCISSGNVKVTQTGSDGKESIVRIATGGDVLGHRSLFSDQNYEATATAMEDTKVCFLDKGFILNSVKENPSVSMQIISKLSRDMGVAEKRISSMHQKTVRERLAELLLLLKKSHGQENAEGYRINLKLTREEMAMMLGTASETLIRTISDFKELGYIREQSKYITIVNSKELLKEAHLEI